MNDYNFGNFLYELRSEKGLSQSQLGQMLGVTNKAVSKWENGSAKPNTNLIPKIAEIFGVTVEELFAGKRIEKESELTKLKEYIGGLKKKYAILSSIYFGILVSVPFLLIEFICVVNGFHINDEILGPLGAVSINVVFIVSLSAYIIYHKNYKNVAWGDVYYSDDVFSSRILKWEKISLFLCIGLLFIASVLALLFFNRYLGLYALQYAKVLGIIYSILGIIFIVLFGICCVEARIARLLKLRTKSSDTKKRNSNQFSISQLPKKWKICYIASLSSLILNVVIKFVEIRVPQFIILRGILLLTGGCLLVAVIVYVNVSNKKQK